MSEQICPNCKEQTFGWTYDDESVPHSIGAVEVVAMVLQKMSLLKGFAVTVEQKQNQGWKTM